MAFTFDEMARGIWLACCAFVLLLAVGLCLLFVVEGGASLSALPPVLMIGLMVGACGAAVAALLFAPVSWAVGRMLRRTPRIRIHLIAFTILGVLAGFAGVGLLAAWMSFSGGQAFAPALLWTPLTTVVVTAAAVAVPAGWWRAYRTAIRRDLHGPPIRAEDPDAAYEDRL